MKDLYLKLSHYFTLLDKIAALEERMDNTAESLDQLCDMLESGTAGDPLAIECCVNKNNNKLVCASVFGAMYPDFNILTNQDPGGSIGHCDRRAHYIPPTTNICS